MMKQTTKRLLVSLAALILSVGAVCTSYAASDKRKVGKMDLVFDSNLGIGVEGSSLSVTAEGANTDRYYISDTDVVNEDSDDFSDSNPPESEVTLVVADEDQWYFASSSSDAFRLNLAASSKNRYDKVQFVSAKRSEKNAMLTLRVKLIYDKKSKLDNRSAISLAQNAASSSAGFGWDSAHPGTASWNTEESARYYQIQLVRNGIDTGIMRSVYKNHYDFSSQMTEPGEYQFRVRTVRQSSHNKRVEIDPAIQAPPSADLRPKAPGMKYRHYAPHADLQLVEGETDKVVETINALVQEKLAEGKKVGVICTDETRDRFPLGEVRSVGARAKQETIAHNLFAVLREFDDLDVDCIYSESFSKDHLGQAIMNRLTKAAGYHVLKV